MLLTTISTNTFHINKPFLNTSEVSFCSYDRTEAGCHGNQKAAARRGEGSGSGAGGEATPPLLLWILSHSTVLCSSCPAALVFLGYILFIHEHIRPHYKADVERDVNSFSIYVRNLHATQDVECLAPCWVRRTTSGHASCAHPAHLHHASPKP